MKSFFYSIYTKAVAVLLCTLCMALAMLCAINGVSDLGKDDRIIYQFEENFFESQYLASILSDPEFMVSQAFYDYYNNDENYVVSEDQLNGKQTIKDMTVEEYIKDNLDQLYNIDKINYFVSINGTVITNCNAKEAEDIMDDADFFRHSTLNADGSHDFYASPSRNHDYIHLAELSQYNYVTEAEVCVSITDSYAEECEALWSEQAQIIRSTLLNTFFYVCIALIVLVYLFIVAGRTKDGNIKTVLIDHMWPEIHIALLIGGNTALVALIWTLLENYFMEQIPLYITKILTVSVTTFGVLLIMALLLSIIRMAKNHSLLQTSLIFRLLQWLWQILKKVIKILQHGLKTGEKSLIEALSKKTTVLILTTLLLYTALIGFFGVLAIESSGFTVVLGILLFGAAAFMIIKRTRDTDTIRKGVGAIRNGNLQYKIEEIKSEDLKILAEDINDIAEGMDRSIADKLKAERMKADLITNVSHDLKTPLTSIINYTKLLSERNDLPEEAKDYVAIIAKKSEGLKNLTHDLFDISKVQSGNETFEIEKLNAAQLIEQSLAEHNSEIEQANLTFCVKTEKELFFMADGRKMSRAIGNLIENALKYAMKNTRVFVEARETEDVIAMEIKNTSAEPMDFDAEEITARFVRGDSSRTDGGNGLGLAIAKSYTEACGGTFRITIDGDLFKATMTFPKKE
ncbi:MAG: HAMP domain-containing histidine kinase [Firmicutes bacterium]|nr:HAMP domain-containing histidine kinase [Bacillota bacterium]